MADNTELAAQVLNLQASADYSIKVLEEMQFEKFRPLNERLELLKCQTTMALQKVLITYLFEETTSVGDRLEMLVERLQAIQQNPK